MEDICCEGINKYRQIECCIKEDNMYKLVKIPIGGGNSHLNESGVTPA